MRLVHDLIFFRLVFRYQLTHQFRVIALLIGILRLLVKSLPLDMFLLDHMNLVSRQHTMRLILNWALTTDLLNDLSNLNQ